MADFVTALSPGVPASLVQTTAYALPPMVTRLHSSAAVDVSLDNSNWAALTGATTGTETGAMFVRCTAATNCVLVCKVLR